VDAAGNVGAPTPAYDFTVDAALPLPGARAPGDPWLAGWRLYAVLGAAAAAVVLFGALSALCLLSPRPGQPARPRAPGGRPGACAAGATPGGAAGAPPGADPALAQALQRSLAEQRLSGHARADADLRAAVSQSLEARARTLRTHAAERPARAAAAHTARGWHAA